MVSPVCTYIYVYIQFPYMYTQTLLIMYGIVYEVDLMY